MRVAGGHPRGFIFALTAALASAVGGCNATATIRRVRGPALVATIDRSDRDAIYVTTPAGPRYLVERSDVVGVDHPGKDLIVTGAAALVVSLLGLGLTYRVQNPSGFIGIPRIFAVGGIVISVPMIVSGSAVYGQSRLNGGSFAAPGPAP
jgi:hypothetical protein